jgi:multidrug efflux pump subunit AcrB
MLRRQLALWIAIFPIIIGVGPLFVADFLRKTGTDTVGFGMMWGLSFGLILTLAGLVVLFWSLLKLAKHSNRKHSS